MHRENCQRVDCQRVDCQSPTISPKRAIAGVFVKRSCVLVWRCVKGPELLIRIASARACWMTASTGSQIRSQAI